MWPSQLRIRLPGGGETVIEVVEVAGLGGEGADLSMMRKKEAIDKRIKTAEDDVAAEAEIEGRLVGKLTRIR